MHRHISPSAQTIDRNLLAEVRRRARRIGSRPEALFEYLEARQMLSVGPVAVGDTYVLNEDQPLAVAAPAGVLSNDIVDEGLSLMMLLASSPTHGSLTFDTDGSFTYTPGANYSGPDSFTYRAFDGVTLSNIATASLTVNAVNDAPVANADSYSVEEDAALTVLSPGVLSNDSDVEGNAFTAVLAAGPAHGVLTLNANGSFSYTPAENYSGPDSFTYRADDGTAGNVATVSLTVTAKNDAPVANNDALVALEDEALAGNVLTNDTDPDQNALSASLVAGPSHGTLELNVNGSFTYTPDADYNGPDSFTYKAFDGTVLSNVATVNITVDEANDAPVSTGPALAEATFVEDSGVSGLGLGAIDYAAAHGGATDELPAGSRAQNLTYTITALPAGAFGAVLLGDDTPVLLNSVYTLADLRGMKFQAEANATGTGMVAWTVTDDGTTAGAADPKALAQSLTITLTGVNDAPTVANAIGDQAATEDAEFSFTWAADAFTDVDGEALIFSASLADDSALPGWLGFVPGTRTFVGTPLNEHVGTISIKVTATDGAAASISDTFDVVIANTNDAPTVSNPLADQAATEDAAFAYTFAGNTFNDVDAGDSLTYTATLADDSALPAWLSFDGATRTFSGTPANGDVGTISIKVTAKDSAAAAISDTFALAITNVNDAPTVANAMADQETAEDALFSYVVPVNTFNEVDAGDTLTYAATLADDSALPEWLSFDAATRTLSGTPDDAQIGAIAIKITATDSAAAAVSDTFTLTVTATNDAPAVANPIADQAATEDAAFTFTFAGNTFSDEDAGDSLTHTATLADDSALPAWLSFDGATRTFSGTPLNGDVGTIQVKVIAADLAAARAADVFELVIANSNDAPTVANAIADQVATEDSAFSFTFAANTFNDVDAGDSLLYSASLADDSALPGWLGFDPVNRAFTGTPANGDVGTISIKVTATDGAAASIFDTFNVVIANTNDAPTVSNALVDQAATEDAAFSYVFAANTFSDVDAGDSFTYSASLADDSPLPAWLSFDGVTRTFSGTPANGDVGSISVKVTATDTGSATSSDTFTVAIANTNDAPAVADPIADQVAAEDGAFSFAVAADAFGDVDAGDSLTYTATLADDSALPAWLAFDAATRTFSGTPVNGDVGSIDVKVTATDLSAAAASDTFTLTINNTNDAPTVDNALIDQAATEDAAFTYVFAANTFGDVDAGDSLTYTATLSDDSALPAWLSFDGATRTLSGTPANGDVGAIQVKVIAADLAAARAADVFELAIANTNDAPTVANAIADQTAAEDAVFSFAFGDNTFADEDAGDSLTYTATLADDSALPAWLSFDAATRTFSGTPVNANVGSIDVKVTATDMGAAAVSDVFTLTVTNTNDAPTVDNALVDQAATEDAAFSYVFAANTFGDVDVGDTLMYAATLADDSALPAWLSFDAATRTFSGTPANGNVGTIQVKVTATDVDAASAADVFELTVGNTNDAPTLANAIADQTANEDAEFTFAFATNAFDDVDAGDSLEYTAALADDSALPGWLSFDAATRTFSGTPANGDVGTIQVKVTATDGAAASISDTFALAIANTNDAPTLDNALIDQAATEDAAFSYIFAANTFGDVDAGDSLDYTATLADDSALPAWLSFNGATRTFSGTPANGDVGTIQVKVTATDVDAASAADVFELVIGNTNDAPTVANAIAGQTAAEDAVFSFVFAGNTFADEDTGDSLAYTATLADDSALPGWLSFDAATRTFSGTPDDAQIGSIDVKVTATDLSAAAVSDTFTLTVTSTNDAPTLENALVDQAGTEDAAFSYIFAANTFGDVDAGDSLVYTATLADDSALPAWLSFDGATRTFSGTPANEDVGTIQIKVTAIDLATARAVDVFELVIANTNDAPTVDNALVDQAASEDAAFTYTFAGNTFGDVDGGDSLAYTATLADDSALPGWLSFDAATRTFSGTPANGDVGSIDVKVTATDLSAATASDTFTLTINNTNDAPTVDNALIDQAATEDAAFTYTFAANTFGDVDVADSMTYAATLADDSTLPAWLSFDGLTRTFSGTPANGDVGTIQVKVTATDSGAASVSDMFELVIANTNDAPTLANLIADQAATEDSAFAFTFAANTFADVDAGDSLTFAATLADDSPLPGWLSFNAATRTFSGTPLNANVGGINVKVTATDTGAATVSDTFAIVVANTNDAPTVANHFADQTTAEDAPYSYTVPVNTFADVDAGDSLTYAATMPDGSALPAWLSFDPLTRTLSGTPDDAQVGAVAIKIIARDAANATVSDTFALVITAVNDAPAVGQALADQAAAEDSAYSFTIPAGTFVDPDAGDSLTYSATLDDGSPLPAWLTFDAATRSFSGTPAEGDVGTVTVRVTVRDVALATAVDEFTLAVSGVNDLPTVANPIADQAATEDAAFTFTFAENTFADADAGNAFTYSAAMADDSALPAWLSFDAATRTFSGTPANGDVGTIQVKVTATDSGNATVSGTFALTVSNTNDGPVLANALTDQLASEDSAFTFTFAANTFDDVDAGDSLTYTATLADDSALPAWLSFDAATRTFSGTPANGDVGSIEVKVTATDASSASAWDVFEVAIFNTNDEPTVANALPDQAGDEDAIFSFTFMVDAFADVDAGDQLTYTARLADDAALPGWLSFDAVTRTFSGTPANGDVGTIQVKVIARDLAAGTVSDTFTLTINNTNDAPTLAEALADQAATEDAAFTYTLANTAFADVDAGDSLVYSAALEDGTALPGWLSFDAGTRTFSGTPGNADVGGLAIRVTATDSANASVSDVFALAIGNVNDAPTVAAALADAAVEEDAAFESTFTADAFGDVDAGDSLSYTTTLEDGSALPAWLTFDPATRTFSGTPGNGDVGTINIKVTATDLAGATVSDTFALAITNANDAPTVASAIADQAATEDEAFAFTFAADTFADEDAGDSFTYSATLEDGSALPAWLTFDAATRTFGGTPANEDVGTIRVKVTATDSGNAAASSVFALAVANTNDNPTLAQPIADAAAVEDVELVLGIPAGTFEDVDAGDTLTWSATLADGTPLPEGLSFDAATRAFTWTPGNGDVGSLGLRVTVTDGAGGTASDVFEIAVANVNDDPVYANPVGEQAATEDVPFALTLPADTFTDVDAGDALTWYVSDADLNPLPAWLSYDAETRTFSGTPGNGDGDVNVMVIVIDNASAVTFGTFMITVAPANDEPTVATPLEDQAAAEDAAWSYAIPAGTFADVDAGDSLVLSATLEDGSALPAWLSFDAATGTFSGTPAQGDVGSIAVKVTAMDLAGASASDVFTLEVTAVNDAPIAGDDTFQGTEDTAITLTPGQVLGNDEDEETPAGLSITGVSNAVGGTVVFNEDASITFTPDANLNGAGVAGFDYTITDGEKTDTGHVTIDLGAVNDTPAGAADAYSTDEDMPLVVAADAGVLANDTDVEGSALSVTLASGPAHGTIQFNADGSFTYSPAADYNGPDEFTYTASDGEAVSEPVTVSLTVNSVADPGTIAMAEAAMTVEESAGTATITVIRSGGAEGAVSVGYTLGGSAVADVDYVLAAGTVAFADGETSRTITVTLLEDALDEADPQLVVTLVDPTNGATLGATATTTLTIADNDEAPTMSVADETFANGNSGAAEGSFTVTLSSGSGRTITVDYVFAGGTATSGEDYAAVDGTLVFNPGETSKTISLSVLGDEINEPDEAFTLTLGNVANAAIADGEATGTITDDDNVAPTAANLTVVRAPGSAVTVDALASAADLDGDGLSLSIAKGPALGTVSIEDNGTPDDSSDDRIVYTPAVGAYGNDRFTYRVSDGQGASATAVVTVQVRGVGLATSPVQAGRKDLVAVGTTGNDSIRFAAVTGGVSVTYNGQAAGVFAPTGRVVALGLEGNDTIIASTLTRGATFYGGAGKDRLIGTRSHDVLVGGNDGDQLVGGPGYNILIGGTGADALTGDANADVLIAGRTRYDAETLSNQRALFDLVANWSATATTANKIAKLSRAAGVGLSHARLATTATVLDDAAADIITGKAGTDWIFARNHRPVRDVLKDAAGDVVTRI